MTQLSYCPPAVSQAIGYTACDLKCKAAGTCAVIEDGLAAENRRLREQVKVLLERVTDLEFRLAAYEGR